MKSNLIYIYDEKEYKFTSFGVGVVDNAYNITIKKKLNDEYSLEFTFNKNSKAYKEVKQNRFVKILDKVFIIRTIEEYSSGQHVEVLCRCEHILFELLDEFMPFMSRQNQTSDTILKFIVNGTRFRGLSNVEGRFNLQVTKGSRLKCIEELCENTNGVRLCSDLPDSQGMFDVWVVPKHNRKLGVLVHNRKNRKSIKRTINGNHVITRLFVYGQEGLSIKEATHSGGKDYIDSPNINDYLRPKEDVVTFDDIVEANTLYELGKEYLEAKSTPTIGYEVEMETLKEYIEGAETIEIGDVLTVIDEAIGEGDGITTEAMVTEITYYPDDLGKNIVISLEEVIHGADKLIADMMTQQETDTGIRKGNVWTEFVTVPFTNEEVVIEFGMPYLTKPVVNVQVIGEAVVPATVRYIETTKEDIVYYEAVKIVCAGGTGDFITMMSIGRV